MEAEVMPLPSPEMTPPDTNMNFGPRMSDNLFPLKNNFAQRQISRSLHDKAPYRGSLL